MSPCSGLGLSFSYAYVKAYIKKENVFTIYYPPKKVFKGALRGLWYHKTWRGYTMHRWFELDTCLWRYYLFAHGYLQHSHINLEWVVFFGIAPCFLGREYSPCKRSMSSTNAREKTFIHHYPWIPFLFSHQHFHP